MMSARSKGSVRRLNIFGTRRVTNGSDQTRIVPGCPLFREHDLPIVVAQCHDLLVVVAVDERDPRALLRFAGQIRHQIIAVEVDLVGHVPDRVALQAACR